ncbi:hypothetical protein AURDEDRAFT_160991, partial [Auricularia subglabra TFB-10046 SS5]
MGKQQAGGGVAKARTADEVADVTGRLRESATKSPEPPSQASRTESSGLCVVRVSAGRLGDADADAQRLRPALRQKPRDRQLFDGARDSRQRR